MVVERLLPGAVAGEDEAAVRLVPESEGEHPAQALDELQPEFLVTVDDGFRVGARGEGMAAPLEVARELGKVVDLAVEDNRERARLVVDRLVARRQVDDAQAPVPSPTPGPKCEPSVSGPR